jgi:hypothetical protein
LRSCPKARRRTQRTAERGRNSCISRDRRDLTTVANAQIFKAKSALTITRLGLLHHQEWPLRARLLETENLDDVLMVELRERLRLEIYMPRLPE